MNTVIRAALALAHRPGGYAVLGGAGLSAGAGVPQAWEVQRELIQRVAAGEGESPVDAFAWWRDRHGEDATYDGVLEQLASTPAERRALLQSFFEPSEEDRELGRKIPSAAHHALARLVTAGHVRVVLTTNFDLLVETALREQGVEPVVVSTVAAIEGMEPLHAQRAVVVHLHGTYLDVGAANTAEELGAYLQPVDRLLDRVLDEYGLMIIGWSARWDTALRAAVERCPARRYSSWWVDARPLTDEASRLAARRDADVVLADAGMWLGQLADACLAVQAGAVREPMSVTAAVRTAKREVSGERVAVSLHDVIRAEVERVRALPVLDKAQRMDASDGVAEHERRLAVLEGQSDVLLALVACAAYWGSAATDRYWYDDIARFAVPPHLSGLANLIHLMRAPAVLLLYTAGVAAAGAGRDDLVARLIAGTPVRSPYQAGEMPAVSALGPSLVYPHDPWPSRRLRERLRPLLGFEVGLGDAAFDAAWERWEYLVAVARQDWAEHGDGGGWTGRPHLLVEDVHTGPLRVVVAAPVRAAVAASEQAHPLLVGGLCGGDLERFRLAAEAFESSYGQWANEEDWRRLPPGGGALPTAPHFPGASATDVT
jgi:hypothetical protein